MREVPYKFVVLDIQEHKLWPKVRTLRGLDDLGDVDTTNEQLKMLHDCVQWLSIVRAQACGLLTLLRPVLAVQDSKLSEDTHLRKPSAFSITLGEGGPTYVCALQAQASLQQRKDLIEVTATFVHLHQCGEFLLQEMSENNVHTSNHDVRTAWTTMLRPQI